METFIKELFTARTFNRVSYGVAFSWILPGVILFGVFADIDINEPRSDFNCVAKIDKKEVIKGKCFEQYEKLYNKFGIPVYAFVIVNFSLIGIVCGIYSQIVKSRVDELLLPKPDNSDAEQQLPNNTPRRKLFIAYCCQLATRFALGILFIVLQTQLLYPSSFPSNFNCHLTPGGSHAANSSGNIQNTTQSALYECHNQRATKKIFWTNAVIVVNGVFALLILIEVICIMARAIKGENFMEDSQFLKDHLNEVLPQNPQQEPERQDLQQELNEQIQLLAPQEPERQDSQQELNEEIPLLAPQEPELPQEQPQLPSFIASMKKSIIEDTEQPTDLKGLFQTNPGEGERTKHLRLDQIYSNLVVHPDRATYEFNTENREEQLKMYPKTRGETDLQPKRREDITDAENKKVLIVGRAGIGKTLFCTKFLRDWASERLFNEKFAVVFLLKLRKFNSVFETHLNLRELLNKSEYLRTDCPDEVWNYIRDNPHKVLLIFDGIDEFIDNSSIKNTDTNADFRNSEEEKMPLSALYEKVASGNLLRGATVFTTTRPGRVLSNIKHLQFKTFEILGFTSEQVDEYVQKFTEDDKCAGKKMLQHISSNINIYSLCYIPVNCFIICSCLLQELKFPSGSVGGLSTKLTQIYKNATKFFFYKHVDKKFSNKSQEEIESDDLPPEMEEAEFKRLREIAFNGIKGRRLIFGSKEVGQGLRDSALFHRLPDRRTGSKNEPQFCFIHLTMQEFFAAKHVTDTMSEAELRRFVADHIEKDEWHVVMQFVAGLLGDRDESSIEIFTDLLPVTTAAEKIEDIEADEPICTSVTCWPTYGQQRLALTLIKSIFEFNQSDSVVESKLEQISFNAVDFSHCGLAPVDCAAVVHVFKNVKQMNLRDNFIGPLGCIEIQKLLSSINCKLSCLDLSSNKITDEGIKHLSEALTNSNCKLNSLDLSSNYPITDEGIKHLSEALTNSNCKLNTLGLSYNDAITDEGIKHLSEALTNSNCKLNSLDLSSNDAITDEGIKHLSEALTNSNCKLNSLGLSYNDAITDEGIKHLSEALTNSNCKLNSLDLSGTIKTDEGITHLSEALTNSNCKLNSLNLRDNEAIRDEGIKHLSEALTNSNCKLNSLDLSYNHTITEDGIKHLSEAQTNSNCKLSSLDLSGNYTITDEGIKHLSEALTNSNCKLSSLNLSSNYTITDEGITHLSEALTNSNCKLSSLDLRETGITDEGIKHLREANRNCKVLF